MRIPTSLFLTMLPFCIAAQIVPSESTYNEGVVWESVFTDGPEGKVNRGLVDSEGHAVCVSMPENQARVHKIDGSDGALIWSVAFTNRVGFGICEIQGNDGQPDYIITGGAGETQECWLARIEGSDGGLMWESIIDHAGQNWQFDGIRTAMIGDDGYIYGSGFIGGDEPNTIFVVFAGQELVLKADPANGEIAWTSAIDASEYGLATVQDSSGELYTGGVMYDEGWCITKRSVDGEVQWTTFIEATTEIYPYDLAISEDDRLYYGGHRGREGAGDPFDYSCAALDINGELIWLNHYANPRGYSLSHIRNELYGIEAGTDGIYMFGGSGDESNYSETNQPFPSSDVWVGWVLHANWGGNISDSHVFCHDGVNSATEYGALIDGGFFIFNDTDAGGDTELGVMKILNGSNPSVPAEVTEVSTQAVTLFPNPSFGQINITGLLWDEPLTVDVFNAVGQLVFEDTFTSSFVQLDLSQEKSGLYWIRISSKSQGTLTREVLLIDN
ncbi:MAG: T9SS type A sorting domain-containing protein [Flavobacteriales bacterium]